MEKIQDAERSPPAIVALKLAAVVFLFFVFLVGVNALSSSFKMMGAGFAQTLFNVSSNPIIALFSGMLATAIIQSSSTTTSIIVGLCSSGALSIGGAVPMIMGANLGTSVTNTLASLGHLRDRKNFATTFSAATVHDIFNILSVAVLLPFEMATGFIEKLATILGQGLYGVFSSVKFSSPIKTLLKPVVKGLKSFVEEIMGLENMTGGAALALISASIIMISLAFVVKIMKGLAESHKTDIMENLLSARSYVSILVGAVITFSVQSSSITTSLMIPMAGARILSLKSIFPITVGANIGTTTTAIIASLSGNVAGLIIALVHFIFNCLGMLIWYSIKPLRRVPLYLAEKLGEVCAQKRILGVAYIAIVFFVLPLGLIAL
ncbi:MAG: Na/Pi symporter [Bacteriovoracales bacterium]|nr:Na/Pi symporter [Bacteriovoracales bacterium]